MNETKGDDSREWVEGEGLKTVCDWVRHGLTDIQVATNIGIGKNTFRKWQREYPKFDEAIKKARIKPNLEIENAMFNLACGKTYVEEIKSVLNPESGKVIKIEKTRKQIPPSPIMLIFLAKNRMRDKYKDYAPTPTETMDTDEKTEVQVYLPDNGRDDK